MNKTLVLECRTESGRFRRNIVNTYTYRRNIVNSTFFIFFSVFVFIIFITFSFHYYYYYFIL